VWRGQAKHQCSRSLAILQAEIIVIANSKALNIHYCMRQILIQVCCQHVLYLTAFNHRNHQDQRLKVKKRNTCGTLTFDELSAQKTPREVMKIFGKFP
jgi:hypothetical protein